MRTRYRGVQIQRDIGEGGDRKIEGGVEGEREREREGRERERE